MASSRHHRRLALCVALVTLVFLTLWSYQDGDRQPVRSATTSQPSERPLDVRGSRLADPKKPTQIRQSPSPIKERTRQLITALDRGEPARITIDGEAPRTLLLQPKQLLGDGFRIILGSGPENGSEGGEFEPQVVRVYGGRALGGNGRLAGRATVTVVDDAIAAVITDANGDITSLKTDPESGELLTLRELANELLGTCQHDPATGTASVIGVKEPATDEDWLAAPRAQIATAAGAKIGNGGGVNPGNGRLDKYLEPLPLGRNYDLSLRDLLVLVVLDKSATGANTTSRFTTVTSEYLARMASVAGIHEQNLGVRLLVQEIILTPNSDEFDDVPASLGNFRSWVGGNRPRGTYRWNAAAKFGDTATGGGVIGVAYLNALSSGNGVSVNNKGFGPALVSHEMGHNMGSGHSSGGIMNPSIITSSRTFFTDVSTGETAAKDIYDHTRSRIYGPATMRHPEQIPFARDDDRTTEVNTPHTFNPISNDDNVVRNGTANTEVRLEEVSRVQPLDAGAVEISADNEVTFTPAAGWEGMAFFSYSLRGNVGNGGRGWLHKGDAAVQVGAFDRNSLDLELAPGQVFSFRPSGSSNPAIDSQPVHAFAGTSRDDRRLIIIRVREGATGNDSFTFTRGGSTSTVNITYLPAGQYLTAVPDILFFEGGGDSIDFNPLVNDQGGGYLSPASIRPTINGRRPITFYFRHIFDASNVAAVTALDLELQRDDGAVVYLNGVEIARDNMPAGTIDFETLAPDSVGSGDETSYFDFNGIAATPLIEGQNVIAVELHQNSVTSSDTAFDLSLTALRAGVDTTLVPRGANWRYLDNGSDQGTAWRNVAFDDSAWGSGAASFGFGDGRETTALSSGFSTINVIPGALRVISATNLDPSKGSLDFSETRPFTIDGERSNVPSGLMSFTPADGATGVGTVEYTAEDGAGNQTTSTVTIILPLVEITEPTPAPAILDLRNGIRLSGIAHQGGSAPLSGVVVPNWSVTSTPVGGKVIFADPNSLNTTAHFSKPGDYSIRLSGDDNGFVTCQERLVRVVDPNDDSGGSGLVGWWKLDESSGTPVADASGNSNHGSRIGAGFTSGVIGGAFDFGANVSQFVNLDARRDSFKSLTQGTIACWFQTNTGSQRVIFAAADGGDSDRDLRLYIDGGKLKYKVRGDIGTSESSLASLQNVNDNEWHHAAITVDAAMNATLYLDGAAVTTGVRPFFSGLFDIDRLRIGQTVNRNNSVNPFRGKIDDLRVYQRALGETEIAELASASLNRAPVIILTDAQPATGGATFDLGQLATSVDDDGRPDSPGAVNLSWEKIAGPGSVSFSSPTALATNATFSTPGVYTLQLAAGDGEVTSVDDVTISYTGAGPDVPISLGIEDILTHQDAPDRRIDLHATFNDAQDADSALTFEIIGTPGAFVSASLVGSNPRSLLLDFAASGDGTADLTIRARDSDGNSIDASFSITVQNFQPSIAAQFFSLPEGSPDGTVVGSIAANDADGDNVSFAVLGGNTGSAFSIDPGSGLIRVADSALIDFETTPGYSLLVAVTDSTHPQFDTTAAISINLTNVNEAPAIDSAHISAAETTAEGSVIGTVSARDPEGQPLALQIVSGNESGTFSIDPADGFLTLMDTSVFNLTANPQFLLTVRATDSGSPALSDTAEIRVSPSAVLVPEFASARFRVPTSSADDATWINRTFVDSSWAAGDTGIGYDTADNYDSLINTDIQGEIEDINGTVYIRIPFNLPDPAIYGQLLLDMKYDDGFVAYLNGTEVARANAPGSPDWDSRASDGHPDDEAEEFARFDISDHVGVLRLTNTLAIHGMNNSSGSSDLLILPQLTATSDLPIPATISLDGASAITAESATLRARIDDTGGDGPDCTFVWGRHDAGDDAADWDNRTPLGTRDVGSVTRAVSGLQPGRLYYFNLIAQNGGGASTGGAAGTFTTALDSPIPLIPEGAIARGHVPQNATLIDSQWRERDFDDGSWLSGALAAGYETGTGYNTLIGGQLDFEAEMFETNATLYLRAAFVPDDPASIDRLTLRMKYDDGFVAYLNGIEVARRNASPGIPIWNSRASADHPDAEATEFENIDISASVGLLANGVNILAIHGLNNGTASSDMLISAELLGYDLDDDPDPIDLYNTWAQDENGLTGAAASTTADPDLDRLDNLLEYAFATDPNTASNHATPTAGQAPAGDTLLAYRRRTDATSRGLSYTIQASADLARWIPADIVSTQSIQPIPGDDAELVTVRLSAAGSRIYFRVKIDFSP